MGRTASTRAAGSDATGPAGARRDRQSRSRAEAGSRLRAEQSGGPLGPLRAPWKSFSEKIYMPGERSRNFKRSYNESNAPLGGISPAGNLGGRGILKPPSR